MAVQVRLNWTENLQFVAGAEKGPAIVMDSKDGGSGPTPMELLLMGIAGCTGIDIVLILQKKRLELSKFEIRISGKQADKYPKRFTEIHIDYFLAEKIFLPKLLNKLSNFPRKNTAAPWHQSMPNSLIPIQLKTRSHLKPLIQNQSDGKNIDKY
jgi:putative redox protein